jgi:hypothetical protein
LLHGCIEITIPIEHPEIDDAAPYLACEAIPKIATIIHAKTLYLVIMKRAKPSSELR